jgi:hypothetical protein
LELPRTATQQILVTEAIDRSLNGLDWPDLTGKSVVVYTGAPGQGFGTPSQSIDENYLLKATEGMVVKNGGRIVSRAKDADYKLYLLAGALGIDQSKRFLGVEGTSGGFIPVRIPELALYKRSHQNGIAKTELVLSDRRSGGIVHQSGPVYGKTFQTTRVTFFVFRKRTTDTTRPIPKEESESRFGTIKDDEDQ